MAAGEPINSQANTKDFEEGYERTFGRVEGKKGGKWVYDEKLQKFVDIAHYQPEERALDAPILSGRFYEEAGVATDGTPIDSKPKHREYMRSHGLTIDSDYKEQQKKDTAVRENFYQTGNMTDADRRQRREDVGRTAYELSKRGRNRG
jgi:hypothetical protein